MEPPESLSFAGWLFRASWQASILIGIVFLLQAAFRKQLTPRWRFCLWFVVLARLALPFSPASSWSLFNWLEMGPEKAIVRSVNSFTLPITSYVEQKLQISHHSRVLGGRNPGSADPSSEEELAAKAVPAPSISLVVLLPWIWLTGVLLLGLRLLLDSFIFSKKVAEQRPVTDSQILDLLEDCKQLMGMNTPLVVVETEKVQTPALLGFIRPRLLLPTGLLENFSLAEIRFIFLHELAHLKRNDIPVNWLVTALQILHWFNPVIWFGFARMRADREIACDALALSFAQEEENRPYGQTILKLVERLSMPKRLPCLAGILEEKQELRERIIEIVDFKRGPRTDFLPFALVLFFAVATLTDAKSTRLSMSFYENEGRNDSQSLIEPSGSARTAPFNQQLLSLPTNEFFKILVVTNYIVEKVYTNALPEPSASGNVQVSAQASAPGQFMDALSPHGRWMEIGSIGHCWQPYVVTNISGWQPFLHEGRWTFSDKGWYWKPDHAWGEIAFHYGNWLHDQAVGWVWVAGTQWSPAAVQWRLSTRHVGWAPLPPASANKAVQKSSSNARTEFVFSSFESFCDPEPALVVFAGKASQPIFSQSNPVSVRTVFEHNKLRYEWALHEKGGHKKPARKQETVEKSGARQDLKKAQSSVSPKSSVNTTITYVDSSAFRNHFAGELTSGPNSGPKFLQQTNETRLPSTVIRPPQNHPKVDVGVRMSNSSSVAIPVSHVRGARPADPRSFVLGSVQK